MMSRRFRRTPSRTTERMPAALAVRIASSLAEITPAAWDACANGPGLAAEVGAGERFNPFVTHAFLCALEESGSVGGRSGWTPAHVIVEDANGRLVAAAPTYLKTHSQGEYVFDHGWADAYQRAGGQYYPKLQIAAPFTPVTGRRLLVGADAPDGAAQALVAGWRALREATDASSIHVTFCDRSDAETLQRAGFVLRTGEQFHFVNEGYREFDDFLAALASRKRKAIKRERRDALGDDIEIDLLTGSDIKSVHWDAFFAFYMETGSRKWGRPYLTRAFFDRIGATLADRVLLVMARQGRRYVAGAINFIGDHALYGRNWGAIVERPFLHFEVCYYQAIDFAIRRGLGRVEAGAQGEHKLSRGYRPVATYSAHEFADSRFQRAVADYLARERPAVADAIADYAERLPFRHEEDG
jgi:predicted N-acyltransferase